MLTNTIAKILIMNEVETIANENLVYFLQTDDKTILQQAAKLAVKDVLNRCTCERCIDIAYHIEVLKNNL